ncbi:MAG: selenium cofactor biosynthesis protein YqeC [Anaerolineae bacterium]
MKLIHAFGIRDKEVVSFVGGGGKTTTMFRLAAELVEAGRRVVTTTTTRIFAAQIQLAPFHIIALDREQTLREVRAALRVHPHVLVIGAQNAADPEKAQGIAPELVDALIALDEADAVLNEADGSRMRPFKAPGPHEPVIPAATTLLVPVVGIDVVGTPLDDEHVHRAEQVAALAGVPIGTRIDPAMIARVITHPAGGLKNRPAGARVIPLVNKAAEGAQMALGREIAAQMLHARDIAAVALGAVKNADAPVTELHRRVAAVVLAAGGSTRMQGELKQLLPWGDSTLVRHTVEMARRAEVAETVVVVGRRGDEVRRQVEGRGARVVENAAWAEGRSTSVRAGLDALAPEMEAALFVNADQPFLTSEVIDMILQHYFQTQAPIVAPVYDGQTGSPVLFDRKLFGELRGLSGEEGGKRVLQARKGEAERVAIADPRAGLDLDTPEQYQEARKLLQN